MSLSEFERKHRLANVLENAIPSLRESILRNFDRMTFKTDEDFNEYLAETSALVDFKEEKAQTQKSNVISADGPVDLSKASAGVQNYVNQRNGVKDENSLGGKNGSEDPYAVSQTTNGAKVEGKEV
jgi:hypothetical protein